MQVESNIEMELEEKQEIMTEAEAEAITKEIELKSQKMANLAKEVQKLRDDAGSVSSETLLESFKVSIEFEKMSFQQVLVGLGKCVPQSVNAYETFRKLIDNKEIVKNHKDRVTGSLNVYQKYHTLLLQTCSMLSDLSYKKGKTVIDTIDELKDNDLEDIDNIDSGVIIDDTKTCIDALAKWQNLSKDIYKNAQEWVSLSHEAGKEEAAWREIYSKQREKLNNMLRISNTSNESFWQKMINGLKAVAKVAKTYVNHVKSSLKSGNWLQDACHFFYTTKTFVGDVWNAYQTFACAKNGMERARETAENIEVIANVMQKISHDATLLSSMLAKFSDDIIRCDSNVDTLQRNLKQININPNVNQTKLNKKLKRIFKSLDEIYDLMKDYNITCDKCIALLKKSVDSLNALHQKYAKKLQK